MSELWANIFAPLASHEAAILEIGSFEGASATRFLTLLPRARITCVDPFTGEACGGPEYYGNVATIEARFDANMASFGSRVEKIVSRSIPALDALSQAGRTFDVIYIDGDHARDAVLLDSVLAWRLLKEDGVLIWDDYLWNLSTDRPQPAIDAFISLNKDSLSIVSVGDQVIVRKSADSRMTEYGWRFPRTLRNLFRFVANKPMPVTGNTR